MRNHRGLLSRAEGCWTFDARDRMSRSSRLLVHPIIAAAENAQTKTRTPSRESGFVLREGFRMPARDDLSAVVRAGVRKPPRKEPAGRWWAVCRLWGFDWAAVSAGAGLGGVVKGGPPSIIEN